MGIGALQGDEIRCRQQVEDEPVVALTEDFDRNAAGLLGDQQGAQVVLAPFLDPGDVRLGGGCLVVQHGLRFFNNRDR